jgi:hypothetical protein
MSVQLIEYRCPSCGKKRTAPAEIAGQNRKCPHCGRMTMVPGALPQMQRTDQLLLTQHTVTCPHCGKTGKVPNNALGKKGRCPTCQRVFQIPEAQYQQESKVEKLIKQLILDDNLGKTHEERELSELGPAAVPSILQTVQYCERVLRNANRKRVLPGTASLALEKDGHASHS